MIASQIFIVLAAYLIGAGGGFFGTMALFEGMYLRAAAYFGVGVIFAVSGASFAFSLK